nr:MAG TPA: REPLICATION INITIATION PROTEIN [Inoviridae sp.]
MITMGVYAKLDWYTVMLYNTSISKIMHKLRIDTEMYEELLDSAFERSYGFVSNAVFSVHGIAIELKWDDYIGIAGDQTLDDDGRRAGLFETEFAKMRVDISGCGLDYLRDVSPDIVVGFTDPLFWSDDPALAKVTRSDFAFDFVNYKPGFVDKFICWIQDAERSGFMSQKSSRLSIGSNGGVQYSYRCGDQKTIYLGSTRGDKLLRIYDKLLQYQKNGVIIKPLPEVFSGEGDVTSWYRIELQTRRKRADEYLYGINGDLTRVLRVLFDRYLVRDRDGMPLEFLLDLYNWGDLPPIIQNAKYDQSPPVLAQAHAYVTGQAFRSIFIVLARYGAHAFVDMINRRARQMYAGRSTSAVMGHIGLNRRIAQMCEEEKLDLKDLAGLYKDSNLYYIKKEK